MVHFLNTVVTTVLSTVLDVAPIVAVLVFFQVAVIRRRLPNLRRIVTGSICVLFGLALFPIGETMARQLTSPETIGAERLADGVDWNDYLLVYAFAAAIGFATTVAEPSLIAVALKAEEVSGGAVRAWGLRIAVAVGVDSARPAPRNTGSPADAARKRRRPQIGPNSRRLRQHQASGLHARAGAFLFRHRPGAATSSAPEGKPSLATPDNVVQRDAAKHQPEDASMNQPSLAAGTAPHKNTRVLLAIAAGNGNCPDTAHPPLQITSSSCDPKNSGGQRITL